MILDALLDALLDTVKTVPFLLIAFLILEALEHYSNNYMNRPLGKWERRGPLAGAIFGCVPQCGFSVTAANLYSGGVITLGTLMAVFLSTSDEAVLILFSHPGSGRVIAQLLLGKIAIGIVFGYLLDFLFRNKKEHKHIGDMCRGCGCSDDSGIVKPAVRHTVQLTLYIFLFTAVLNLVLGLVGMDADHLFGQGHLVPAVSDGASGPDSQLRVLDSDNRAVSGRRFEPGLQPWGTVRRSGHRSGRAVPGKPPHEGEYRDCSASVSAFRRCWPVVGAYLIIRRYL